MNNSEELKYKHLIELGKLREYNGDKKIVNLDNICSSEKEYNATTLYKSHSWLQGWRDGWFWFAGYQSVGETDERDRSSQL